MKLSTKVPIKIIPKDKIHVKDIASGAVTPLKLGEQRLSAKVKLGGHTRNDSKTSLVEGAASGAPPKLKLKIRPPSATKNDVAPP